MKNMEQENKSKEDLIKEIIELRNKSSELEKTGSIELKRANERLMEEISGREIIEEFLQHRLKMESLMALISSHFINIRLDDVDKEIGWALKKIGEFEGVERCYINTFSSSGPVIEEIYEWCSEDIILTSKLNTGLSLEVYPWLLGKLRKFENIIVSRLSELPPEAGPEKKRWKEVKSVLAIPLVIEKKLIGLFGFTSVKVEKIWKEEDIKLLKMLGEVFINLLERRKNEEKLRYRLEIENLMATISKYFVSVAPDEFDGEIICALQAIGEFAGADRCFIYLISEEGDYIYDGYEWCSEGIKPGIEKNIGFPLKTFSWSFDKLKKFEYIYVPSIFLLPPEAIIEKEMWQARGIKSLISIPMVLGGKLIGYFGFNAERKEELWEEEDIRFLMIVGEIFVNVLDRKWAEEEKKELEREIYLSQKIETITTLAAGIAHNFNNMFMGIIGYTELVLSRLPVSSEIDNYLKQIINISYRAKGLTKQILEFSRQGEFEKEPVNFSKTVMEVLKLIRASIPENIDIIQDIDVKNALVMGDQSQLYQMVMNLCTNAVHAMAGKEGILEINLYEMQVEADEPELYEGLIPGTYFKLVVRDTGEGINSKLQERIFDPFFTTGDGTENTGMGLAVVQGIVENHRGKITLESEPGIGTIFEVYIPGLDMVELPEISEKEEKISEKKKILFIDDEEVLIESVHSYMESMGYNIISTSDSKKGLEYFETDPHSFDLIVTDQSMPEITGVELTRKILSIRPDVPVILFTGFSKGKKIKSMEKKLFKAFVEKPVTLAELAKVIASVLRENSQGR